MLCQLRHSVGFFGGTINLPVWMDDLTTGKILLRKRKGSGPHLHICYICLDHISIILLEMGYSVSCGIVNGCCFWLDLSHYTARYI